MTEVNVHEAAAARIRDGHPPVAGIGILALLLMAGCGSGHVQDTTDWDEYSRLWQKQALTSLLTALPDADKVLVVPLPGVSDGHSVYVDADPAAVAELVEAIELVGEHCTECDYDADYKFMFFKDNVMKTEFTLHHFSAIRPAGMTCEFQLAEESQSIIRAWLEERGLPVDEHEGTPAALPE